MVQALPSVDSPEIIAELRKRGFGIDSCHGYAFRISTGKPNKHGSTIYTPIGGVTVEQLNEIKQTSRNAAHAAERVRSISCGETHSVTETDDRGGGETIKMETLSHLIDNRVRAELDPIKDALKVITQALGQPQPMPEPLPATMEPAPEPEPEMTEPVAPEPQAPDDLPDIPDDLPDDPKAAPRPTPTRKKRTRKKRAKKVAK